MKLISWNLLHRDGASLGDVARLVERERPDLLLMQEDTTAIEGLVRLVGGVCARAPLPGRMHDGCGGAAGATWRGRPPAHAGR